MIQLDTSVLIDALTGPRRLAPALREAIESGERLVLSSIVLYEWLRGPRVAEEVEAQEALFPGASAVAFGSAEAALAADLYRAVKRPRGREIDLAVAACSLSHRSSLWTRNTEDFADVPDLRLYFPRTDTER